MSQSRLETASSQLLEPSKLSTTLGTPPTLQPPPVRESLSDPDIDYGYRYVQQVEADGAEKWVQVPLTRDDVLHPQEGDCQLHNDPHQVFCNYLFSVFKSQLRSDPSTAVFHDTGVFWDDPTLKHNSPDITVIIGVTEQKDWVTFHVEEEGVRPELLIEVTSPATWSIDLIDKRSIYQQAGVPGYVVVETDRKTGTQPVKLHGYTLTTS